MISPARFVTAHFTDMFAIVFRFGELESLFRRPIEALVMSFLRDLNELFDSGRA